MNKKIETGITILCSAIPYIGGPLSVITSDYFNERKEQRLIEFVESIKNGLDEKTNTIIQEYINGDDFLDVLENTIRYIIFERQSYKRKAYQNILVKSITTEGTTYDDTEEFQHFVSILKIQHFQVLKAFSEIGILQNDRVRDERTMTILALCSTRTGIEDRNYILELIKDLETYNLVDGYISDFGVLGGGAGMVRREGSSLTKKGYRFLDFILADN